jgi:hypothetical protein
MTLPPVVVETGAGIDALMVVLGTTGFTTICPYPNGFEFVGVGFGFGLVIINLCIRDMQYNYIF